MYWFLISFIEPKIEPFFSYSAGPTVVTGSELFGEIQSYGPKRYIRCTK